MNSAIWLRKLIAKSWVRHLAFWVLSFVLLSIGMASEWPPNTADFIYAFVFHFSLVTVVYLHLRFLFDKLLLRKQYLAYAILLIGLIVVAVWFNIYSFNVLADILFPGYFFVSPYAWKVLIYVLTYLVVTTSLKLSRSWIELQRTKLVLEATRRMHVETELKALRAQVQPHFLFNSLHSIYALALEGSTRTPEVLLRLSNVLRFMLYESEKDTIPLDKEIQCIAEFVALQKERLPPEAVILWDVDVIQSQTEISPLLLMPMVENAFKHGGQGARTNIAISLDCRPELLSFTVSNSYDKSESNKKRQVGGIGLQNLRRRLTLLYKDNHSLNEQITENQYSITLKLNME